MCCVVHDATSHKAPSSKHYLKGFGLLMAGAQAMQHVFLAVLAFFSSAKDVKFVCEQCQELNGNAQVLGFTVYNQMGLSCHLI